MPPLAVVLDDPRLRAVRERDEAGDDAEAARELDRVRAGSALDGAQACAWSYVAGRLHLAAGDESDAAAAFEQAASDGADGGPACPLADYARLRQAQSLLRAGRYPEAIAALRAIGDEFVARDEATLTRADAALAEGDRSSAVPIWRALLAAHPRGVRWVDIAFQLALALVDGVDGPPELHADEAVDLSTRLLVEAPGVAEKLGVGELRDRAARAATHHDAPPLTVEERARKAQAWLDDAQPKRARQVAESVLASVGAANKEHAAAACKAAIIASEATPRGKADDAADAWGAAIARCEGDDALVTALFQGGKASASAKRRPEAILRFDRVEKQFPKHRLADDARLRAAAVVEDEGDETRALSMLSSLPDAYPEGDMRGEALFRVALAKVDRGDFAGARESLDRVLGSAPDPVGSSAAGRAEYFRARVAELMGDSADAKARYAALVSGQPLSYYMLLAYARLRAEDDALARSTLEEAVADEPAGPFRTREHAELASAPFERFLRLLEVGEIDAARREANAGGLVVEGADSEVLWTVAWLYDQAGAPELGHSFARGRLVDYRVHWPAGRWRLAWEIAFPRPWEAVVMRESALSGIPAPLTWAIMREESAFNPGAKSPVNAVGLMQLMAATARLTAAGTPLPYDDQSLRQPDVSIALGARLLASLRASFPSHPALAIAAYNSGSAPVRRWMDRGSNDIDVFVEHIAFEETRAYVKRVLASEATYAYLYAPQVLDEVLQSGSLVVRSLVSGGPAGLPPFAAP